MHKYSYKINLNLFTYRSCDSMETDILQLVLTRNNFNSFNPMQQKYIDFGFNQNAVISAPTASGKTITAEIFLLNEVINKKKKVIYTCPLRALANEHYLDFKKKYPEIKFSLSTGDLDSSSTYLKKFDVIFTTYEKLASLLRHKSEWLNLVGGLIIDEVHEIDSDRGPVLEVAITQLRNQLKNLDLLALSATIPNSSELAKWLNAKLIESDYRPTKLIQGISTQDLIEYNDFSKEDFDIEQKINLTFQNKNQILTFLNSRKRAESYAKKITSITKNFLNKKELTDLNFASQKILSVLEQPTEQCHTLADCVKQGSAFHHAGLLNEQKIIVEELFKTGKIKIISATTTVAAGVNLPADLVIIPSPYRFTKFGMDLIPVREYKQMVGRSGRPKYSTEGRSILNANSEKQKELFLEKYVNGEVEKITSKLSQISILKTHVLALISTGEIYNEKSIKSFFEKTFYATQASSINEIIDKVLQIITELKEYGFVKESNQTYSPTLIGKRVSDLFLDPESAYKIIQGLKSKKPFTDLSYLFLFTKANEFSPKFNIPKPLLNQIHQEYTTEFDILPYSEEELLYGQENLESYYSALVLKEWISETKEQDLFEKYNISPGILFNKNQIIEWLAYSIEELSKLIEIDKHIINSKKIGLRIKYGVRSELLPLIELKGIGRVRARKLYSAGIKSISDIKNNFSKVELIVGKNISDNIKKQLKLKFE
ncbi:MAG: DEAD/DEAH box helicase [Candidatus ainarchaeum sp.]|nr:DEAD/DEAH box helicase [Candidatus ainarchaeum sp.]